MGVPLTAKEIGSRESSSAVAVARVECVVAIGEHIHAIRVAGEGERMQLQVVMPE